MSEADVVALKTLPCERSAKGLALRFSALASVYDTPTPLVIRLLKSRVSWEGMLPYVSGKA
jgi:hypothetical protein